MRGTPATDLLQQMAPPDDVDRVLGALSRHAVALRSQNVPPTSVRVSACGVTLELSWAPAPSLLGSVAPQVESAATSSGEHPAASDAASLRHQVCSPTVGVFYRAAEPGAQPLVGEGDLVVAGQQVGVVEAMKLMIPVEADQSGRVREVLVANGAPVEHGQPLLRLGPTDSGAGLPDGTR
jgi:acetyl-CoA carboxylase biotin carboxyl carrier protein